MLKVEKDQVVILLKEQVEGLGEVWSVYKSGDGCPLIFCADTQKDALDHMHHLGLKLTKHSKYYKLQKKWNEYLNNN